MIKDSNFIKIKKLMSRQKKILANYPGLGLANNEHVYTIFAFLTLLEASFGVSNQETALKQDQKNKLKRIKRN